MDVSLTCSVCFVAEAQPGLPANMDASPTRPREAAYPVHNMHTEYDGQNNTVFPKLVEINFPDTKSNFKLSSKSENSRSVWCEQKENNQEPRHSVVSDEEANGLESFDGKQIFIKPASEDVYEYESSVDHDSIGAPSLSKTSEERVFFRAGMDLDEILPLTPIYLSDENHFFSDQIKTLHFNSNFGRHRDEIDDELNNNCKGFAITSTRKKTLHKKSKSSYDDCTMTEWNGQISSSVPSDHHRTDPPCTPGSDNLSPSLAEYSLWEPSTLIEQDLNTAFLRSDSFISFLNRTKYTNKSSSLFSGCSSYRDTDEVVVEKKNSNAVHGEMEINVEESDCMPKQILKSREIINYSSHDGWLDPCIVQQKDSIDVKKSEFGVDDKSKLVVIPIDDARLRPCGSNSESFGIASLGSLTNLNIAQGSSILRAPNESPSSQDISITSRRCSADIEVYTQEQKQINVKPISKTELDTHRGKAETPSVLVVGKPPKCGGKWKSSRKRSLSLGVVSHKLLSPQAEGKSNRLKQSEGHSNKLPSVVEYFDTGASVPQEKTSYVPPNAAEGKTHATHTIKEKMFVTDKVKDNVPSELRCNTLNRIQHHVTACTPAICELKPNSDYSNAQKYTRLALPPQRRKFDLADTDSCSSSQSSQVGVLVKENKCLKSLASVPKTPACPSSLKSMRSTPLNHNNKLLCTPNKVLRCGKNASVLSNKYSPPKVSASNPRDPSTERPTSQSKYCKKQYYSPKMPMPKTPRPPKIKQILSTQCSGKNLSSNSRYSASKQTPPYETLKSDEKNKVKVAFSAPWRPPVSIITEASPPKKTKSTRGRGGNCGRAGISQKSSTNRREGVGSSECLDEAIIEATEGSDDASLKLVRDADDDLESIRRCGIMKAVKVSPKATLSPCKRPEVRADVEAEIPFGLSSAVYDLVRKFNAINGGGHNSSSKKGKETEVPSCDPVSEVQCMAECISAPVQDLFVCSPIAPPHTNIPAVNNLHNIADITKNGFIDVPDTNLTNGNTAPGVDSNKASNERELLNDTTDEFEANSDKISHLNTNPNPDNLLASNHTPCSVAIGEAGASKSSLPTTGDLPATSTHHGLSSTTPVSCTGPGLSTPGNAKGLKTTPAGSTVGGSSVGSALTIVEEFVYSDPECGVTLIERRCPSLASVSGTLRSLVTTGSRGQMKTSDRLNDSVGNAGSVLSSLPDSILRLSADTLSRELAAAGSALTGPVTETTAKTYARLLHNIRQGRVTPPQQSQADGAPQYSRELRQALQDPDCVPWDSYRSLEHRMSSVFTSPRPLDFWRGGTAKVCFNYLLLDPAITQDLPLRAASLSPSELFRVFVSAVFYVGKGCKARPYAHLYQALDEQGRCTDALDKPAVMAPLRPVPPRSGAEKVSRILRVWEAGGGVVSLHVFQHTIPAEAWTREAAMIDAIGLSNLSNCVGGSYYGPARGFPNCDRKALGVVLLHRAMLMLLCEGERQLRPPDLPPNPWANRTKKTRTNTPNLSP